MHSKVSEWLLFFHLILPQEIHQIQVFSASTQASHTMFLLLLRKFLSLGNFLILVLIGCLKKWLEVKGQGFLHI